MRWKLIVLWRELDFFFQSEERSGKKSEKHRNEHRVQMKWARVKKVISKRFYFALLCRIFNVKACTTANTTTRRSTIEFFFIPLVFSSPLLKEFLWKDNLIDCSQDLIVCIYCILCTLLTSHISVGVCSFKLANHHLLVVLFRCWMIVKICTKILF